MPFFRFLSLLWALSVALVPALQAGELVLPASVDAGQTDAAAYAPIFGGSYGRDAGRRAVCRVSHSPEFRAAAGGDELPRPLSGPYG